MRLFVSVTALGFMLVAIAAGMWPSWALASSLSRPATIVTAEPSAAIAEHSTFKPCYHTVRTVSCFPQMGLPEGSTHGEVRISRHCVPVTSPSATKSVFREAESRPPRSSFIV